MEHKRVKAGMGNIGGDRDILFLASDTGPLKAIEFLENFISPKLQGRNVDLPLQRTLELIQPVPWQL